MRAKPRNAKFAMESLLKAIIRYARQALKCKIRYGMHAQSHNSLCAPSLDMQNSLWNPC